MYISFPQGTKRNMKFLRESMEVKISLVHDWGLLEHGVATLRGNGHALADPRVETPGRWTWGLGESIGHIPCVMPTLGTALQLCTILQRRAMFYEKSPIWRL